MKKAGVVRECEHPGHPHSHGYECYRFDNCRCRKGRAEQARKMAAIRKAKILGAYQPHLIDSTGTRRRIQALMLLGYTASDIGALAGLSRHAIYNLTRASVRPQVERPHAEAIARLYDKLWDKPAPDSHGARYVSRQSQKRGYVPPLAWDEGSIDDPEAQPNTSGDESNVIDFVAVERAVAGMDVQLTDAELEAAAAALMRTGVSRTMVTKRLGIGHVRAKRIWQEVQAA